MVCLGTLGFLSVPSVWAAQATLVADAHVNSAMPSVNSGAISNLVVGGGYTTLLQFDLSMLPSGTAASQVARAVLRLYVNRVTTAGLVSYSPVTAAWGEYSVTYATEPAIGSAAGVVSISQAGTFIAVDVTSLVQGWIASPATNNGLALSGGTAFVQFDSKENDQTSHPATLDIELVDAGPPGATGLTGPQGAMGAAGPVGATGLAGSIGLAGAIGPQGPAGATGSAGQTGTTGATGPMGIPGPAGATGATGPQGPAGPTGTAGAGGLVYQGNYASTQNYALGDVVLWQGSSYTSLIASNHGNTPSLSLQQWSLLAAQGPAGPTGAAGVTGASGPQGLPGSAGPNGPIGPQGPQGIAGQAGAQGIPGANGATGLSGPQGPQGIAGPVGLSFQGVYSSTTNYALADGVSYNGTGYVSLVASNHGNTPDQSPRQWALFAAAGASGATGLAGTTGATGSAGPIGPTGLTGAPGPTGPIGPSGMTYEGQWTNGTGYTANNSVTYNGSTYIAVNGNTSERPDNYPVDWSLLAAAGAAGASGAPGAPGATGATGLAGATGATGAFGAQGPPVTFLPGGWLIETTYAVGDAVSYVNGSSYIAIQANTGRQPDISPQSWGLLAAAGAPGSVGPQGPTGMEGPSGIAGQKGDTGPPGPAGPAGSAGATGTTGATGSLGPTGATGQTGATGANGIPGTNGANGTNGAPGPAGMIFKGTWLSGYGYAVNDAVTFAGSTYIAQVGNSSSEPDNFPQVWALLAQAGTQGPTGPSGLPATATVGSVTTGAPGTQAAVSNSGTASAAVLNFIIPQGAAGAAGSGGSGGGSTSGIPFVSMYHLTTYTSFVSVNTAASSTSESAPVLTWVPAGCTATALNVYSQQTYSIAVTLRVGATPATMAATTLVCSSVATGGTCSQAGSVAVPAGSFIDLGITGGANSTSAGVWTALACN